MKIAVRPILVRIGPVTLKSYGLLLMVGLVLGLFWAVQEAKRKGVRPEQIFDLAFYVLIASLVLSRVVYVLLNWNLYGGHLLDILRIWEGGLSFHGGVLGGFLAALVYCRRKKESLGKMVDIFTPSLALGYIFGRIGCFLNGCCYGMQTESSWGMKFPDLSYKVHPAQLYASVAGLFMFLFILWLKRFKRFEGQLFLFFLVLYSVYRFLIEFLRKGVTAEIIFDDITQAQFASGVIIVGAVILIIFIGRRSK